MDGTLVGHMLGAVAFYLAPDDQLVLCLHHIPTSRIIRIPLGTLESPTHLVALAARFLDLPES
jgi:hypothetical protein